MKRHRCADRVPGRVEDYLAGRLVEADVHAFEVHYFECDACWAELRMAVDLRAALEVRTGDGRDAGAGAAASGAAARERPGRVAAIQELGVPPRARWWIRGLAAAAVLAGVAFGISSLPPIGGPGPEPVLRGSSAAFAPEVAVLSGAVTAAWPRILDADVYRVRVFSSDGRLLHESESPDTAVMIDLSSLGPGAPGGALHLRVAALDVLRDEIVRSPMLRLDPARPSPAEPGAGR